jgi:GAF domain-containing protein
MARADATAIFDRWPNRAAAHQHARRSISAHADGRRRPVGHRRGGPQSDPRSRWITALAAKRGPYVTAVAVANRNARICWALLARGEVYRGASASGKLRLVPLRAAGKNTVG